MDCQTCNTRIDYRFLTNCEQCGNAVEPADVSELKLMSTIEPGEKRFTWRRHVGNFIYVLASSVAGMFSGAVILYFSYAIFCITVLNHIDFGDRDPSASCARGTALAFLSIMIGAFLGTAGGSAFAVKRPLFKTGTGSL
ncbi:MAG TPA: hypothetical protein VFM63_11540 [Pyrinomonadaceae bacterium]|nr:hypothetical protein [Pyrinomonadaceae bacterium]